MELSYLIDGVLIILLGAVLGYSVILHKKLTAVRKGYEEFTIASQQFTASIDKAELTVSALRAAAQEQIEQEKQKNSALEEAEEELKFLIERAEKSASQLEKAITASRKVTPKPTAKKTVKRKVQSKAERDLQEAMGQG